MQIGLIADSHIPEAMPELPGQVRDVFADVDLILHAGDMHCLEVLDWLEQTAPVLAVRGNGDEGGGGRPVVPDDPRLQDTLCLTRDGWNLGMVHDVLDPEEMPTWPIERTVQHYFGQPTDIIICGHTHVEGICCHNQVWVHQPRQSNLSPQPGRPTRHCWHLNPS